MEIDKQKAKQIENLFLLTKNKGTYYYESRNNKNFIFSFFIGISIALINLYKPQIVTSEFPYTIFFLSLLACSYSLIYQKKSWKGFSINSFQKLLRKKENNAIDVFISETKKQLLYIFLCLSSGILSIIAYQMQSEIEIFAFPLQISFLFLTISHQGTIENLSKIFMQVLYPEITISEPKGFKKFLQKR